MKNQQTICYLTTLLLLLCYQRSNAENIRKSAFLLQAEQLFEQAQEAQKQQHYSEAIPLYTKLVELTPSQGEYKEAASIMTNGLSQLMYCYIFDNRRKEGADYFSRIHAENTCWIVNHALRDVEVCLAYALYETANLNKAVEVADRALSRSATGRTYQLLYADYGMTSVIYNQVGQIHKAIDCNLKCIDALRKIENNASIIFALGNLIWQYQQIGEFEKSLATYDELINSEVARTNPYGVCAAEINVIELYSEWGLEEEVDLHLAKAMDAANACGIPEAKLRTFTRSIYQALLQHQTARALSELDSMKTYLPPAEQTSHYHKLYKRYRIVSALQSKAGGTKKNIAAARNVLEEIEQQKPDNFMVLFCRLIGDALAEKGEKDLAIKAYLICSDYILSNNLLNQERHIFYALALLLDKTHRHSEAFDYLKKAWQANRAFVERRNTKMLSQFRVKYETNEKEQANKQLKTELELKHRTLQYYIITIISLLLAGCLLGLYIAVRRREAKREINNIENQLRLMLADNLQINKRNEELRGKLEQKDAQESIQEIMNRLSPRLLTYEEENDFRKKFAIIHPSFLTQLRDICPEITRSEELLLMLFRLKLTPEEVSFALGNNRASVYSSRSRVKRKLKIDKETSLEQFIQKF